MLVIITPAKNEENNIPRLVKAMAEQVLMPDIWILINDRSEDDTKNVFLHEIKKYDVFLKMKEYPKVVDFLNENSEYALGEKYSKVIKFGLDNFFLLEKSYFDKFDYIGVLDSDVFPSADFYSFLLKKMESDKNIGIAAGGLQKEESDNEVNSTYSAQSHAPGGLRIWRRECLDETGYYPSMSQDAVSQARAIMMGWKVKSFPDAWVSMRKRGGKAGFGYYGKSAYSRCLPFWYVVLVAVKFFFNYSFLEAKDYVNGYLLAKKNDDPKIQDEIAIKYFKNRPFYKLIGK